MRFAIILLLLATSAFGQMHGHFGGRGFHGRGFHGPGVVRSGGFGHGVGFRGHGFGRGVPFPGSFSGGPFFPGVPASVTSLGPCGFTPCVRPFFKPFGFKRFGSPFFRNGFFGGGFVGAYPIAVPVPVYANYAAESQPAVQQPLLPQRLEITIVHQRDKESNESSESPPESPRNSELSDPPNEPAIFIFRDGTRRVLRNFAIMRGQLIDLSDGKMFRIPLERVDREKTLAANAETGREIRLP